MANAAWRNDVANSKPLNFLKKDEKKNKKKKGRMKVISESHVFPEAGCRV